MKRRKIQLPRLRAQASVAPETLNESERTVEVRFYSGAAVERFPLFDEPYTLRFSLDPKAVRLGRFNAGAPLVDNHNAYGSVGDVVLGVVQEAWLAADGGHATVKIAADRPDIIARMKDGILKNFSMGAVIHEMRDVTEKGEAQKHLLATDWEPMELSIVPVGADAGAQALRLSSAETFPCEILGAAAPRERNEMKIKVRLLAVDADHELNEIIEIDEQDFDARLHSRDLEKSDSSSSSADRVAVEEALEADRKRTKEIKRIQAHFNLSDLWAHKHSTQQTDMTQILADAAEERARIKSGSFDDRLSLSEEFESIPYKTEQMAEALFARSLRKSPPESARQFALSSIAECAYQCLDMNGRARGRNIDARRAPAEVVQLALHTTSDFPKLLENVLNKSLLPEYEAATPTYRQIAARKEFKDFRAHSFVRAGDFPVPLQVNEHGEFKHGTISEGKETVTAVTYGRILGLSRQVLVNDDLGAFADFGTQVSRRIADFENATFYSVCILPSSGVGPALADGLAVYHATHANIAAAGLLNNTTLGSALEKMLLQASLDGLKMTIKPQFLLVSPASYVLALTLLAPITPAEASKVNPFAGQLTPLVDANLGSQVRFYVLADPGRLPNYIYGGLQGQAGPRTEVRPGFEVDGIEIKVAIDFGCGAIEYRGGVTGAGV